MNRIDFEPSYLKIKKEELKKRCEELWKILEKCHLCPRDCGVNRLKGEIGFCKATGTKILISSYFPHFGEERGLVGKGGSGTIFFTYCNLRCIFCQNWEISHLGHGYGVTINQLADIMLELQKRGCHNINFVTPTHYSPFILKAIDIAADKGLILPIVYNTSGWEKVEILKFFDGVVDIYLPDFKYWDSKIAKKYSPGAENYPEITKKAIIEMNRQVGVAKPAKDGIIYRGLMIRHLVMPNNVSGSEEILKWIAENLPKDTYINIMPQYTPHYKAFDYPEIARRLNLKEYRDIVEMAKELGFTNLDIRAYFNIE
ncbi:MAG: radical SAM protein [Candidatus Omnitrophica bacterium]|nr:radical SAM protein [Candidatus Omnitrophota bacterium]